MLLDKAFYTNAEGHLKFVLAKSCIMHSFWREGVITVTVNGNLYRIRTSATAPDTNGESIALVLNLSTKEFIPAEDLASYVAKDCFNLKGQWLQYFRDIVTEDYLKTFIPYDSKPGSFKFVKYLRDILNGKCDVTLDDYDIDYSSFAAGDILRYAYDTENGVEDRITTVIGIGDLYFSDVNGYFIPKSNILSY